MTRRKVITDNQVLEIRAKHIPYVVGYAELAREYGCGESTIRDIVTYRTRISVRARTVRSGGTAKELMGIGGIAAKT